MPADTARALVFGESKIETTAKDEAKSAEAKTEATKTDAEAKAEPAKTEQKDAPEDQL